MSVIAMMDVSVQASELVCSLVQVLPKSCTDQLTVIFANDDTAQYAVKSAKLKVATLSLGEAFLERLGGVIFIVGAKQDQASHDAKVFLTCNQEDNHYVCC